jgi:phospholipid transport system substrate-binding protein
MIKAFAGSLALAAAVLVAAPAFAQEAPDAMVKRVSQETLATIRSDPLVQAGDQAHIRDLIEAKLAPHFDFTRMTALAMGRNWRSATPEQQKELANQFRALLVRTYAGALNQYRNEQIDYKPFKMNPDDTEVTVRTVVTKTSGQPVSIDYSLEKTAEGWKAYDVVVAGVSLVTNYRDEFNAQIKNGGIDGLIKTLADRNKGAPAK